MSVNKTTRLDLIENRLSFFEKYPILTLILICVIAIAIRVYFAPFDLALESQDAFYYMIQADEISKNQPTDSLPPNYGWQFFISIFLRGIDFENDLAPMNLLRILSMALSVITIPVVYLVARQVTEKPFSLLAAAFFAFDPNLIENSIFGISEPFFIFVGLLAIYFALLAKNWSVYLASLLAGISLDIRLNGVAVFIVVLGIYLSKNKGRTRYKELLLFLVLFSVAASPFFVHNYENSGNPFASFFGFAKATETSYAPTTDASQLETDFNSRLGIALSEEFKHIFRVSIPYLALFVPFGLFVSAIKPNYRIKIIIFAVVVSLLVAIPQYFLSAAFRNLFFILPFFAVIASFGLAYVLKDNSKKNLFLVLLIAGIILLSYNMLRERTDIDLELLEEKESFGKFVAQNFEGKIIGFQLYPQIIHHVDNPSTSPPQGGKIGNDKLSLIYITPAQTMKDLTVWAMQNNATHIVITDVYDKRTPEMIDVFYNEGNYPYLTKVFDTKDEEFKKLRAKVFEFNYNKLE